MVMEVFQELVSQMKARKGPTSNRIQTTSSGEEGVMNAEVENAWQPGKYGSRSVA